MQWNRTGDLVKMSALLAFMGASAAYPQAPAANTPSRPDVRSETTIVLVPALVRNSHGELVFTLTADDFKVTDDGVEQKLTLDKDTDGEPLALVIAVETGGAGARKLASYRNIGAVIASVVGDVPHRIAVVGYDSTPRLLQDFTSDEDAAGALLNDVSPGDKGAAILDGLAFSLDLLRKQPPAYRRAILLISETVDHGSQTKMEDALRAVSDTNTAIYALGFSSSKADMKYRASHIFDSHTPGPAKGCMAKDANTEEEYGGNRLAQAFDCLSLLAPPLRAAKMAAAAGMDEMQRDVPATVAQLTGGEFYKFEDGRSLARDLVTISNHVPNRYVLSFHPQAPHAGFHVLRLRLKDHPELRLTARTGYWVDNDTMPQTIH